MHVFPVMGFFGVVAEFEKGEFQGKSVTAFGVSPTIRLPLNFKLFCISPKAEAGIKIGFGDPTCSQFYWGAGVETTFNFGIDWIRPGVEVSYRSITSKFSPKESFGSDTEVNSSGVMIKAILGITFD